MHLEHDEVVVTPPQYRLFDCMRVRVCLMPDDETNTVKEDSLWRVKVYLGMIPQDNQTEAVTASFRLGDIPRQQEAIRYWHRVQARAPVVKLGRSILLYLKHLSGVRVEFPMLDGAMKNFIVHLGTFEISGELPENFAMLTYFGETSKLED